jgi:hypothetical protein
VKPPVEQPSEDRQLGKGGQRHRYLQALVKKLAEELELKATLEAPLPGGGQVDVLIERDGVVAGIEISVTTAADHDREKLRKCLAAGYPRVAVVVAKSKGISPRYGATLLEGFSVDERARVSVLTPEAVPDFIAALAPPPSPTETIVKGYRVRVSHAATSPDEARARREQLGRIIAQSLTDRRD